MRIGNQGCKHIYKLLGISYPSMERKYKLWLMAIVFVTLITRLVIAFTTPNFTYDSYFHLKHIEHIAEDGFPKFYDELSYGGRELRFLPFFHYTIATFSFFGELDLAAKIMSNVLMSLLVIIVFMVARKVTENDEAALFSAFIAGFLPALFIPNHVGVDTLFFPLIFLAIYSFLNLEKPFHVYLYIGLFLLLCFTTSATFLLVMGFGIYLLLAAIEEKKVNRTQLEVIIFSLFFFIWTQFLFFKEVLLREGVSFVWQNVPGQIIANYFPEISIPVAILLVSIIPFLAGIYVVYKSLFQLTTRRSILLISLVISTTLLAWFRLIPFRTSLAFFGIILSILFAVFYTDLLVFFRKTKFHHHEGTIKFVLSAVLVITILPLTIAAAYQQETPTVEEVEAFLWLRDNTPEESGVLSLLEEGDMVNYYSKRRNLMDEQFALENSERRFNDLNTLYKTAFQAQAIGLLDHYDLNYLVLTPRAKEKYEIFDFTYRDQECFDRVYKNETRIYKVRCTLQTT